MITQDVNGALPPPGLPVTHVRLLTKVARMYHERGLRQPEIARLLHMSQPRVSRLLKEAAEVGIVRTTVVAPRGTYGDLEEQIERRYGLAEVVVADTDGSTDEIEVLPAIAAAAAAHLETTFTGGDTDRDLVVELDPARHRRCDAAAPYPGRDQGGPGPRRGGNHRRAGPCHPADGPLGADHRRGGGVPARSRAARQLGDASCFSRRAERRRGPAGVPGSDVCSGGCRQPRALDPAPREREASLRTTRRSSGARMPSATSACVSSTAAASTCSPTSTSGSSASTPTRSAPFPDGWASPADDASGGPFRPPWRVAGSPSL